MMSPDDDSPNLCRVLVSGRDVPGLAHEELALAVQQVLAEEGCPPCFEMSVLIVDDDEIADLHQRYMSIAGPTDVLSFPQDDPREPPPPEPLLGDVAVSVDTAAEQAADNGISVADEVTLLAVHGALHLMGHDDIDPADASVMRALEQRYVPQAFSGQIRPEAAS